MHPTGKAGHGHTISILGMLNGSIKGNTDLNGKPLDNIIVRPLRLGGGALNIYILGFAKGSKYKYAKIDGISNTPIDQRSKQFNPRYTYYNHFDMEFFLEAYADKNPAGNQRFNTIKAIIANMLKNGRACKVGDSGCEKKMINKNK